MSKLPPYAEKAIKFCEQYAEGKHMLAKVAKSTNTKIAYSMGCKFLSDYLGKTLSEIVAEYKADVQKNQYEAFDKWETIFDDFAIYLRDQLNYKSASVHVFHIGAKALINTNVPRSLRLQAKTPEVYSRTIPPITFEDLKSVYEMANVRERAFIAFLKDSGISASDAVRVNIGDLEGFDKGESWIRIRVLRKKEHVEYETFIGNNAITALRAYLKFRERRGEKITKETPIFITETKPWKRLNAHALQTAFRRIKLKTGIVISTHRLRKFFETYMALTVRHPIVLKYWMGHKIKRGRDIDARYIIPPTPEQLKLYAEAYKNIDLRPKRNEKEQRIQAILDNARMLGKSEEEIERIRTMIIRKDVSVEEVIEMLKRKNETNDCDCQKIISLSDLETHLNEGWKYIDKLPNGKVVIER